MNEKIKLAQTTFFSRYRVKIDSFLKTAFTLIKICATLFILWRLGYILLLLYFYLGNIFALSKATRGLAEAKQYRKFIYNPFRQYKAYYKLLDRESQYKNFSVGFWFLLIGVNSIAEQVPAGGFLLTTLFICLWPSLATLEWYYQNRAKTAAKIPKMKLYAPIFAIILSLNFISPLLQYTAAKQYSKKGR